MSKIKLHPMFEGVSNRMGNIVYASGRNGRTIMRRFTKAADANSDKQKEVRSTFKLIGRIWRANRSFLKNGWDLRYANEEISGTNGFFGVNISNLLEKRPLLIMEGNSDMLLHSFVATSGSVSGTIVCTFNPNTDDLTYLSVFVQEIADNVPAFDLVQCYSDVESVSPVNLTGLKPGVEYFVYAVLSDKELKSAKRFSSSYASRCVAKA